MDEILPRVEGEIPHAQATAPTSGGTLIFEVSPPGDGLSSQITVLGARRLPSRSHLFCQGTASPAAFVFTSVNEVGPDVF